MNNLINDEDDYELEQRRREYEEEHRLSVYEDDGYKPSNVDKYLDRFPTAEFKENE